MSSSLTSAVARKRRKRLGVKSREWYQVIVKGPDGKWRLASRRKFKDGMVWLFHKSELSSFVSGHDQAERFAKEYCSQYEYIIFQGHRKCHEPKIKNGKINLPPDGDPFVDVPPVVDQPITQI